MACIHSLTRIGVDHLVAVDGAYPGVEGGTRWSGVEQSEAVQLAADAAGIGLTLHRPDELLAEREKRSLCFRLAGAIGEPMSDWVTVIDADEVIANEFDVKAWLATGDAERDHVGGAKMIESIDPATTEGKNNTPHTPGLYRNMDIPARGEQWCSRFWRLMPEMWVQDNHYSYHGRDVDGVVWNLRPDIAGASVGRAAGVLVPEFPVLFEHRDPWRTAHRRRVKREYYDIRNAGEWERVPEERRYNPHERVAVDEDTLRAVTT
jgi:hypothetical protein